MWLFVFYYCGLTFCLFPWKYSLQRVAYFRKGENYLHWTMILPTFFFIFPPGLPPCSWNWQAGVISVFVTWMNFIFVLNRYSSFSPMSSLLLWPPHSSDVRTYHAYPYYSLMTFFEAIINAKTNYHVGKHKIFWDLKTMLSCFKHYTERCIGFEHVKKKHE